MIVLTGKPGDSNSLEEPMKVAPVEHSLAGVSAAFEQVFLGYSVTVLELHTQ
jgi:alpha-L-arabinofuranosidase